MGIFFIPFSAGSPLLRHVLDNINTYRFCGSPDSNFAFRIVTDFITEPESGEAVSQAK
jgi:hypothetical protein